MPTQPTVEINQPEAISSDSHSPIYYTGKTKAAMSRFKGSANYLKFKQEYEQAIQNIIDFYKQHVSSQGKDGIMPYKPDRITTVENMFIKFKTNLFSENSNNRLHHLYQAKKHIEEIAQSLQEERNIPTAIKMDEIRELAGKIMMCGSGAYSHIIATKLSLTAPSGELSDNFSVYKNTIAHAVITEFISRDLTDINPAEEIHLFNLYWNIFSKRLGVAAIEDKLSIILIFTTKIAACQNALQQAFTPYRLTDKLATDHWNNLHNIIGDAAEWEQINNILAGVKSSYKPINVYALIEEAPDSPGKYRLRQDKTWLQVEIAKQLALLPPQIAWINWKPIAVEGNRLQKIGDLFWQEIDGELSLPTIEDLVKYADQMAYKQLIDGITHAKEQDAIWLSRIDPQYLQATNADDLSLFFSKLGAEKGIEYAKINLRWFNKLKFNPLITTLLTLPPEQLATLSSDLLCYINDEELNSFFLKLGNERFIRYAQDNPHWLTKLIVDTPALIKMLSKMPDSEVANLDTSFLHWIGLNSVVT